MRKRICVSVLLAALMLGAGGTAKADISVWLEPSSYVVGLGDIFTVDILADIPIADGIVGFGMDATFDALILGHDPVFDVSIGSSFDPAATLDGDALAGTLPFGFPPPPPVSGDDVLLATMTFEALSLGTTSIDGGITVGDPLEGFALPGGGAYWRP